MDREGEAKEAGEGGKRLGRGWTTRSAGPIRYRRYTDLDAGGRPYIFFKFEPAPGGGELSQEIYDVLRDMKHLDLGEEDARGARPSGLQFNRDRKHGRVWKLPDTPTGRTAADVIDARLGAIAGLTEEKEGRGR